MAAGKDRDHQLVENFILADHDLADLLAHALVRALEARQACQVGFIMVLTQRNTCSLLPARRGL
jgi:hypothetical protein